MIKLVVSDMDGTLLSKKFGLSERNFKAIQSLQNHNIAFAIASGRDYDGVYSVMEKYNIHPEAILGNGAQYVDDTGKLVSSQYMDHDHLKEIFDIFMSRNIPFMIFASNGFYTTYPNDYVKNEFIRRCISRFNNKPEDYDKGGKNANTPCCKLQFIENIDDFVNSDIEVIKVEAFYTEYEVLDEPRKELASIEGISYLSSFVDNIEICHKDAQKGLILKQVAKLKGLDYDEIAVLGDGMNDISLFENFKYGFATGNAEQPIKDLSYKVVADCEDDGFAEAIDYIISEVNHGN